MVGERMEAYALLDYHVWRAWLIPPTLGLNLGVAFFLAISRLRVQGLDKQAYYPAVAVGVGVLALLFAPAAWAAHDVLSSQGGGGMGLPSDGPRSSQALGPPVGGPPGGVQAKGGGPGGPPGGASPGGGPGSRNADPALVEYLQANRGDT